MIDKIKKASFFLCIFALAMLSASCAEQKPAGPPDELTSQLARSKPLYNELKQSGVSVEILDPYEQTMQQAQNLMNAGDYKQAMESADLALAQIKIAQARATFAELEQYNPGQAQTYQYRIKMAEATKALQSGNHEKAVSAAEDARAEAQKEIQNQKAKAEAVQQKLQAIKQDIEFMYKPPLKLVNDFWSAHQALQQRDYEKAMSLVDELQRFVQQEKQLSISGQKYFLVHATRSDLRKYGDPRVYAEITSDGYLKPPPIATVPPGTKVNFVRSLFFSPDKTFYMVELPGSGIRGWMAEYYVWPERAEQHK